MGVVSVFFAFFMRVNVASIGKIDEGTCSHIAHQLQLFSVAHSKFDYVLLPANIHSVSI